MARGISTNVNIGSIAAALKAENISFAARYYSSTTRQRQKRITRGEAQEILRAGIALALVYEDGPTDDQYFSRARGEQDARHALDYAAELGQPAGTAIYFAVDYDAPTSDVTGVIQAYFDGIGSGLAEADGAAKYEIGVYGSGRVCAHIKEEMHLAKYSWLAESHGWAGHSNYAMPDIRQEIARSTLAGLSTDGYEDNFSTGPIGALTMLMASSGAIPVAPVTLAALSGVRASDLDTTPFAKTVAATALQQYTRFHDLSEDQTPLKEQIRCYWEELGYTFPGVQTPWSAVFISWTIRTSGAAANEFKTSNAHSRFVFWAIQNTINATGMFRAQRLAEYAPRIGDIIHHNRGGQKITYDFAARHEAYESHSAIVVELGTDASGKYVMTIGGNESDTVSRRRHAVHPDGTLVDRTVNPYICVIQNLK